MNKEARLYKKLLILTTVVFMITTTIIVLHYETDSTPNIIGDPKKTYTAQDIRNMIKLLPNYQGDSLLIDSGRLKSLDGLIQSTLSQVYLVKSNYKSVKDEAKVTGLPEPLLVYKTGIAWYVSMYGSKLLKKSDSIDIK